jgi:hypothetical protein
MEAETLMAIVLANGDGTPLDFTWSCMLGDILRVYQLAISK